MAGTPSGGAGGTGGTGGVAAGAGGDGAGGEPEPPPLPPELTWRLEEGDGSAIWGSGPNDIYIAGSLGTIMHSTGDGVWTSQVSDTNARLTGIWGSGPADIYISVSSNVILHSTGNGEWEHQGTDVGFTHNDVWGTGPDNIYALIGGGVMHSSGDGAWELEEIMAGPPVAFALWGSSPTDIYLAAGFANNPTIYHSTGDGTWRGQTGSPPVTLDDITGAGPDQIYATGGDAVYSSRGDGAWTVELTFEEDFAQVIWALDSEHVYACTQNDGWFYSSNGAGTWSSGTRIDPALEVSCGGIWGTSPSDLYVATSNGIYHGTAN
jgi:hypothetical protein